MTIKICFIFSILFSFSMMAAEDSFLDMLNLSAHKEEERKLEGIHYITILPLITNLNEKDSKKVHSNLAEFLDDHKKLNYKTDQKFYKIFNKRKKELRSQLYEKKIIQTVASKVLVGSLVRAEIISDKKGFELSVQVLGKDAQLFFSKKKRIYKTSLNYVHKIITFWLDEYANSIEFDATLNAINDKEVLIDFAGDRDELHPNKQFVISRKVNNVDTYGQDQYIDIAYGIITQVNDDYVKGKIVSLRDKFQVDLSDVVHFKEFDKKVAEENLGYHYRQHDLRDYRKHGMVSLYLSLLRIEGDQGKTGDFTGLGLVLDFFLPSQLILMTEFEKKVGKSRGDAVNESNISGNSLNDNNYKLLMGYSFAPSKSKLFNYIDVYAGWVAEQRFLSGLGILGVGDVSFKGPAVGVRMEHSIYKNMSLVTRLELQVLAQFEEQEEFLGKAESASGYSAQVGIKYRFPRSGWGVESSVRYKSNSASIENSNTKLSITATQFLLNVSKFF